MRLRIAVLCTLVGQIVFAQMAGAQLWEPLKQRDPQEIARAQTDFWTRTLGLSPRQTAALQQINLRYASSAATVVKSTSTDAEKRSTLRAADDQKAAEVADVLTPPQRDRYLAIVQRLNRLSDVPSR